ncbi:MAG: hypothetical protein JKY95_13650 [Planctomycetaceae bacterium]|nr:hypothetical protein [Planctomycetaceae bacterium]
MYDYFTGVPLPGLPSSATLKGNFNKKHPSIPTHPGNYRLDQNQIILKGILYER